MIYQCNIKAFIILLGCLLRCKVGIGKAPYKVSLKTGILLSITTANTTCGYENGKIVVTATGGVSPYLYSLNGASVQGNGIFYKQPAGLYTVTITDALMQVATASVTLTNTYLPPTATVTQVTVPTGCVFNSYFFALL